MKKKISIIVLSYNEENNILPLYQRLSKVLMKIRSLNWEIIYINNGSTDRSDSIFRNLCRKDKKVRVVVLSRNFFPDNAIFAGLSYAHSQAAVVMEGDLQDPPEVIPEFIRKWNEGYQIVYGVRKSRMENIFLVFFRKLYYRIIKKMAYVNMPLDAGTFSLVDKSVVNILNCLPEKDSYFRGLRAWVGFKQTGVAYKRDKRLSGRSTNSFIQLINWSKRGLFSFSYKPLEMVSYLSYIALIFSFATFLFYIGLYIFKPDSPRGIPTIISLVIIFGSLQLFVLSTIGEYLSRIFEEIKGRPKYIITEVINGAKK